MKRLKRIGIADWTDPPELRLDFEGDLHISTQIPENATTGELAAVFQYLADSLDNFEKLHFATI